MRWKMKLRHKKSDVLDVVYPNLLMGKNLHPVPQVLVPLACNVVGNNEENKLTDGQAFQEDVVRVEVPGVN